MIVVVLGARNEHRLLRLDKELIEGAVAHVAIRETDGRTPNGGRLGAGTQSYGRASSQ
jgi:hypothetical protein